MSVNLALLNQARTAANRLRNIGTDCGDVAAVVRNKAGGVPQFWQGLSANALTDALNNWSRDTQNIEHEIASLATDIIRAANMLEVAAARGAD